MKEHDGDKPKRSVGNQPGSARKWPKKLERQAACAALCDHLENGYSMKTWPEACYETIQRYIKDFPEDFCPDRISRAMRISEHFWEKIGLSGTVGKLRGFNPKSWEFIMQNRFGWRIGHNVATGLDKQNTPKFDLEGATTEDLFTVQSILDKLSIDDDEN